jgi:RND family efflux transporter MFP subunit
MPAADDLLSQLRIDRKARPGPTRSRRRWWIGGALVLLGLLLVGALRGRPVEVQTATAVDAASAAANASVLDASGYVTARRIATVSSKITGKVSEVFIEEGQHVEQGEVLARLDATDLAAQRALAGSQLEAARAQLAEAGAQLRLAERTLARQRELAAKKLVAAAALDAALADRDTAAARLATTQRNVAVATDSVAIADLGLDNTVIRAPFTGVIVTKAAQPGEMISPVSAGGGSIRTGIGTLVDMDSLEVQVDVNEAYIGRVQPEMTVEAVLNAYPDWKIPAEVIAIVPTADRSKATVKVRIALKSKDPRIVPDMGVRVSFLERTDPAAPRPTGAWVPASAVRESDGKKIVLVVDDGRARAVAVTTGASRDADVLATSGLKGGEALVVAPATVNDGDRVVAAAAKQ